MNWHGLDQWQQWALAIGGSLAAAFIGWFCKLPKHKSGKVATEAVQQNTVQQNASPVMAQNFQPNINIPIDIHPPVGDPTKDTVGHLRTLQIDTVRKLWKHIAALHTAFCAIPKAGGVIGPNDEGSRRRASTEFVDRFNEAGKFLHEEILLIPKSVADEADALLKIARNEAIQAARWPDPFDGNVSTLHGEKGWGDFLDGRSNNLTKFNSGTAKLQDALRDFLEG